MSYIVPALVSGETLPDAEALATWGNPGEEQLFEDPHLVSWLTADNLVDGSGNYADRGPRGMNGLQATVGNQPAIFTRTFTDPVTGLSVSRNAWIFDGTGTQKIPLNFELPPGPMTIFAVLDIDSSVGTGDNVIHSVVGSGLDNTASRWMFEMINRKFQPYNTVGAGTATAAQAVSAPLLVAMSFDPMASAAGVSINGGAFTMTTPASPSATSNLFSNRDVSGIIGFGGGPAAGSPAYKGHIYSVVIANVALSQAAEATRYALYANVIKARNGL